jgi:VWFA-related protein
MQQSKTWRSIQVIMPPYIRSIKKVVGSLLSALLFALLHCLAPAFGQTPQKPREDEVVRIFTNLIQTDVMVFDKQGTFVNGLRREDFELRIDGKPKAIEFFDRVTAGAASEESQLAAARGATSDTKRIQETEPLDRRRTIFFYIDDLHMDLSGLQATRKMLTAFIEGEMGQNDQAAISSASGQIGFLQQLSDNRAVLRAALDRLKPQSYFVRDFNRPPMTEYQALLIDSYDKDVTDYFVDALIREFPLLTRDSAQEMVRNRAHQILAQAANITNNTLVGLERLVRGSQALPGRKLVFFISNGFFLDRRNSTSQEQLQKVTSFAARSGAVIYSMDARGLVASSGDVSLETGFDPSGRLERAGHGELLASQDALNALAVDTGGRAIFNTNALEPGLRSALKETALYYLLAWKPDSQSNQKLHHIEVRVVGKPELRVRIRRGSYDIEKESLAAKRQTDAKTPEKTPEARLQEVINSAYPVPEVPLSLNLTHLNTPEKGDLLSTSTQIPREFLTYDQKDGKLQALIDIAGLVYNDRGEVGARFNDRIIVSADTEKETENLPNGLAYNFPIHVAPGLYQVRVAATDVKSGRTGSTNAWLEIPDLSRGRLALSSLVLRERMQPKVNNSSTSVQETSDEGALSLDHHFRSGSFLRFLVFVYNAVHTAGTSPDVALQVQVTRDEQPVVTTALRRVSTEGIADLSRLPYGAEIPLEGLPAGHYLLKVTVVDRLVKQSATQQTRFLIK